MIPWLKIPYYFGVVGCLSIVAWFVGFYMIPRHWRSVDRTLRYWQALGFAVVGLLLASWNYDIVARIRIEQKADLEAAEQRMERLEAEEAAQEKAEADGASTGTVAVAEAEADAEPDAEATDPAADTNNIPAYRRQGIVEREGGKAVGDRTLEKAAEVEDHEKSVFREMPEIDVSRANRYARQNNNLAWMTYLLAMALVIVDYLSRFNRTLGCYYPLSIADRSTDENYPKTLSVRLKHADIEGLRDYLERVVRKGEGFVYFGPDSPWRAVNEDASKSTVLKRTPVEDPRFWLVLAVLIGTVAVLPLNWLRTPGVYLKAFVIAWVVYICLLRSRWRLPLLAYPPGELKMSRQFLLETSWFDRYGIIVLEPDSASDWIERLRNFLAARMRVLARARRTIHIVWNYDSPIPDETLQDVLFLCGETNYKFVLVGDHRISDAAEERFEETIERMEGEDVES